MIGTLRIQSARMVSDIWRSRGTIVWPIVIGVGRLMCRIAAVLCVFSTAAALMRVSPGSSMADAAMAGGLVGCVIAFWAMFHAACKAVWWRSCAHCVNGSLPGHSWLADMARVLGLDLVFGGMRGVAWMAVAVSAAAMLCGGGAACVVLFAAAGVSAAFIDVWRRLALARCVKDGLPVIRAAGLGLADIANDPVHALCAYCIPCLMLAAMELALCISLLGGTSFGRLLFLLFGVAIALALEPILWLRNRAADCPRC